MTTKTIKQIAFPTEDGTALLDSTKYVWSVNGVTPDPDDGSIHLPDYVLQHEAQTIDARHNFSNGVMINGVLVTVET